MHALCASPGQRLQVYARILEGQPLDLCLVSFHFDLCCGECHPEINLPYPHFGAEFGVLRDMLEVTRPALPAEHPRDLTSSDLMVLHDMACWTATERSYGHEFWQLQRYTTFAL